MKVLVAGLSGQLGTGLVEALGSHDIELVPLMRPPANRRRRLSLERQFPDHPALASATIIGDVCSPNWGLDSGELAKLSTEIDAVINLAGETNWAAPMADLVACNVTGAEHGFEVASELTRMSGRRVPYVYASSVFVAGSALRSIPERRLEIDGQRTAYEQSKWLAEQRLFERVRDVPGVPLGVARVCPLLGNSVTGGTVSRNSLYLLADHWRRVPLKVIPAMPEARVDALPRDIAGDLVLLLTTSIVEGAGAVSGYFHIAAGESAPTLRGLLAAARQLRVRAATPERIVPVPASAIVWASKNVERFMDMTEEGRSSLMGIRYIGLARTFERGHLAAAIGTTLPSPSVELLSRLTFGLPPAQLTGWTGTSSLARFEQ